MELRQFEYVLAVAEELHFGRAAERMRVSQQSVSEQVRRLERELGAPLFTRTSRRVGLTSVGEAFLPEARRTVAAARHALDTARRAARGSGGELRVGHAEDLGPGLFRLAVPALAAELPAVTVVPVAMGTPDQLRELREQRLDVAFGWDPEPAPDLDRLLVAREPLVAVLSPDDPQAGEEALDPQALSGRPLVLVERAVNPGLHQHFRDQLEERGVRVVVHSEHSTLDQVLPLVLSSAAVGLTTAGAAARRPDAGVAYVPFPDPSPHADHVLVWRRDTGNAAVVAFVDVVRRLRDAGAFLPATR